MINTNNKFPRMPVLIVDDEKQFLYSMSIELRGAGITNIVTCLCGADARNYLEKCEFSVIILDIKLPDIRGTELLDVIIEKCPETPVIMITAVNHTDTAVECMKKGASDYLVKPFDVEKMLASIKNLIAQRELTGENEALKRYLLGNELKYPEAFSEIVTKNNKMHSLLQYVEAISATPFPVLITGETGSGKELFSRAIHKLSGRKGQNITVNVAGVDENTFYDTLFGHVKGAFTGADRPRSGLIEKAEGGTLFLDEIGDLSQSSQIKLLRVIQNRDYMPLGADIPKIADVRIIVDTNKSLDELKSSDYFRSDLFHRLRTHHIAVPPLRYRLDDIPLLVEFFTEEASTILKKNKPLIPVELYDILKSYSFPGNVRELRSMIFDAVAVNNTKYLSLNIFRDYLGLEKEEIPKEISLKNEKLLMFDSALPTIREAVNLLIDEALFRTKGNQSEASKILGITPQALSRRLKFRKKEAKT